MNDVEKRVPKALGLPCHKKEEPNSAQSLLSGFIYCRNLGANSLSTKLVISETRRSLTGATGRRRETLRLMQFNKTVRLASLFPV